MARLIPSSSADRSDATAFAGRVARWDPAAAVRLVDDGHRVTLWADTPFDVLATRAVQARLRPSVVTVHAGELLAALAVSTADEVDPGRGADAAWRVRLPPADGWMDVDDVPAERITELVRSGTEAARTAGEVTQRHASRPGSAMPAELLDAEVLTVDGAGMRVTVSMRVLFTLSGMGFVGEGPDDVVRVRATRTWLRVDARYGAVARRRVSMLPLLV